MSMDQSSPLNSSGRKPDRGNSKEWADGVAVINVDAALKRMGGDRDLVRDIARFFVDDAPGLLQQLRQGLQAGQADEVAHAAHTLKGLASNFDAFQLQGMAAEIEQLSRASRLDAVEQLLEKLAREADRVEKALIGQVLSHA